MLHLGQSCKEREWMSTFGSHKTDLGTGFNGAERSPVITEPCCRISRVWVGAVGNCGWSIFKTTLSRPGSAASCGGYQWELFLVAFSGFPQGKKRLKLKSPGKEGWRGPVQQGASFLCSKPELPISFLAEPQMPLKASWDGELSFSMLQPLAESQSPSTWSVFS